MTILEARQRTSVETAKPEAPPPSISEHPPPKPIPFRKIGVWAILIALAFLAIAWAVEDPIAHAWYQAHQGSLARDFQARRFSAKTGQAIATIQVPSLGVNVLIAEGDSVQQLRSGPGHKPGTAIPGAKGNSVIVGHRHGWGGPFAALAGLHPGDSIFVENRHRDVLQYTVTSVKTVSAGDPRPFARSDDYRITLITGNGGRFTSSRLAVTAISGAPSKAGPSPGRTDAAIPAGSPLANRTILLFVLRLAVGIGAFLVLRRRFSRTVMAVVLTPIFAAAVLALMLDLDLLLAPLG